ncbi:zinc finger cchc domain-containing protein [Anaeramoeba flamelloides]|uniref:Zinc finger cchc domain-containing protein n=1 Tax=Anaeramoeba flamelloides TaxID=1746091 RepID=A0AAV7Z4T8_9EUKA|nr:zinc finger cchc domain-containing protein [Anaeramoeba flamelloides]
MEQTDPLFKIEFPSQRKYCRFRPNNLQSSKYLCKQKQKKSKKKKQKEQPSDTKLTKLENLTFPTISSLIRSQLENSTPIRIKRNSQTPTSNPPTEKKTNIILKFLDLRLKHLQNKKTNNNNNNNNTFFGNEENSQMEKDNNVESLLNDNNNSNSNRLNGGTNTKESNKKQNYVWDPRFTSSVPLQDILRNVNPGLVLNLYINCFSFFHEPLSPYDPQFKPLFESIINGRIDTNLFRTIRKNKSKFYNGYLVVDILDYRNRMSNRFAKPDIAGKIMKEPDLQQNQQQQQSQSQSQKSQKQTSSTHANNNNPNTTNLEIKQEPLDRSLQNKQNLNLQGQPQHLRRSIKKLEFDEQTDKKRKVLLSLDEETFKIVVVTMEYLEYSLLLQKEKIQQKNRMLKLGLNPNQQTQQAQQHFERVKKQLQRLVRWGSEKQTRFQQKLLLVRSFPTCFGSSIDIFKIANHYFNNKHKQNYIQNKFHGMNSKFHHSQEINKKLIKKILNYNQHKKKIGDLVDEKKHMCKLKFKKKKKKEKKQSSRLKNKKTSSEMGMKLEIETFNKADRDRDTDTGTDTNSDTGTDTNSDTDTDTNSDTDADGDPKFESEMDIEKESEKKKKKKKKKEKKKKKIFKIFKKRSNEEPDPTIKHRNLRN